MSEDPAAVGLLLVTFTAMSWPMARAYYNGGFSK